MVLIDPGPRTESELYSSSTQSVPIGAALPGDPAPAGPVDIPPDTDGPAPDLFDPSDHIISTDPPEDSNRGPASPDTLTDARLAQQAAELTGAAGAVTEQPRSAPNSPTHSFKDYIQSYLSKLWFLRARSPGRVGCQAAR